jgi:hypothetical protein
MNARSGSGLVQLDDLTTVAHWTESDVEGSPCWTVSFDGRSLTRLQSLLLDLLILAPWQHAVDFRILAAGPDSRPVEIMGFDSTADRVVLHLRQASSRKANCHPAAVGS